MFQARLKTELKLLALRIVVESTMEERTSMGSLEAPLSDSLQVHMV